MNTQVVSAKIPFLRDIAGFSLDVSFQVYSRIKAQDSERVHAVCKQIVRNSDFSRAGPKLNSCIKSLKEDDQKFLVHWINTSYFAEDYLGRSWATFDFATGRYWVKEYGFSSVDECVELLGARLYKQLNELAHEMGHQFMLVDEFCAKLEEKPLSEWDMLVAGKYDLQAEGWDITDLASEYCVAEIFRHELRKIPFTDQQIDIINKKVDEYIHSIHPNKPKIDIRDILR